MCPSAARHDTNNTPMMVHISMAAKPTIFDLNPDQLRQRIVDWNMPSYRADQLLHWLYNRFIADPTQMTDIAVAHRQTIAQRLRFTTGNIIDHQTATDGVQKLLVQWQDDDLGSLPQANDPARQTECVMIPTDNRKTACISSQIGCPVGCTFCASGLGGLDGNLSAGQIVEQVWRLATLPQVGRITHVVFMGMGEPLANFDAVTGALDTLTADWGLGISARRITVSTVGLPAQIRRLAQLGMPITLAISLHAPNDALRRQLIPWAEYVSIDQLIDAGQDYFNRTGREVTLEYILLRQVNDQPEHAHELARLAKTLRANVNLIRYNEVASLPFNRPDTDDVHRFQGILRHGAINTHIRASRGRDIAAACGQLRHEQQPLPGPTPLATTAHRDKNNRLGPSDQTKMIMQNTRSKEPTQR